MMDCIGAEIEVQDAQLNQAYLMVMRPLPKPEERYCSARLNGHGLNSAMRNVPAR